MKKIIGILILCLCVVSLSLAQGIEFYTGSWNDALLKAEKENKIIFVDAYAEWCGPCKVMARNVFPKETVGKFFNDNFINYKMDMEHGEGPDFGRKYPVRAYPTLMFIDYTGKMVHQKVGAQNEKSLIQLGKVALSKIDRSEEYAAKYEKGDRSPELILKYISALNQAGKPSLKIANSYLRGKNDYTDPTNLKIVFVAMQQVDSRIYNLFETHFEGIKGIYDQEAIDQKLIAAGERTLKTAIEFEAPELWTEAKEKVNALASAKSGMRFSTMSDIQYNFASKNFKAYAKALKEYTKTFDPQKDRGEALKLVAKGTKVMTEEKKIGESLEEISSKVAALGQDYRDYIVYAKVASANGNTKTAMKALDNAEELCSNRKPLIIQIQKIREELLR